MTEMIVDPANVELDELGNPIDYFNLYKREMQKLAHSKFDPEQDIQFFSYLDRLINKDKFTGKGDRINGLGILKEFVTGKASLTYVKRRNEQTKRWEYYRQKRID